MYGRSSPRYNQQYSITLAREQMTIENISSRLAMVDSWRDVFSDVLLLSVVLQVERPTQGLRGGQSDCLSRELTAPLPACVGGTNRLAVQSTA